MSRSTFVSTKKKLILFFLGFGFPLYGTLNLLEYTGDGSDLGSTVNTAGYTGGYLKWKIDTDSTLYEFKGENILSDVYLLSSIPGYQNVVVSQWFDFNTHTIQGTYNLQVNINSRTLKKIAGAGVKVSEYFFKNSTDIASELQGISGLSDGASYLFWRPLSKYYVSVIYFSGCDRFFINSQRLPLVDLLTMDGSFVDALYDPSATYQLKYFDGTSNSINALSNQVFILKKKPLTYIDQNSFNIVKNNPEVLTDLGSVGSAAYDYFFNNTTNTVIQNNIAALTIPLGTYYLWRVGSKYCVPLTMDSTLHINSSNGNVTSQPVSFPMIKYSLTGNTALSTLDFVYHYSAFSGFSTVSTWLDEKESLTGISGTNISSDVLIFTSLPQCTVTNGQLKILDNSCLFAKLTGVGSAASNYFINGTYNQTTYEGMMAAYADALKNYQLTFVHLYMWRPGSGYYLDIYFDPKNGKFTAQTPNVDYLTSPVPLIEYTVSKGRSDLLRYLYTWLPVSTYAMNRVQFRNNFGWANINGTDLYLFSQPPTAQQFTGSGPMLSMQISNALSQINIANYSDWVDYFIQPTPASTKDFSGFESLIEAAIRALPVDTNFSQPFYLLQGPACGFYLKVYVDISSLKLSTQASEYLSLQTYTNDGSDASTTIDAAFSYSTLLSLSSMQWSESNTGANQKNDDNTIAKTVLFLTEKPKQAVDTSDTPNVLLLQSGTIFGKMTLTNDLDTAYLSNAAVHKALISAHSTYIQTYAGVQKTVYVWRVGSKYWYPVYFNPNTGLFNTSALTSDTATGSLLDFGEAIKTESAYIDKSVITSPYDWFSILQNQSTFSSSTTAFSFSIDDSTNSQVFARNASLNQSFPMDSRLCILQGVPSVNTSNFSISLNSINFYDLSNLSDKDWASYMLDGTSNADLENGIVASIFSHDYGNIDKTKAFYFWQFPSGYYLTSKNCNVSLPMFLTESYDKTVLATAGDYSTWTLGGDAVTGYKYTKNNVLTSSLSVGNTQTLQSDVFIFKKVPKFKKNGAVLEMNTVDDVFASFYGNGSLVLDYFFNNQKDIDVKRTLFKAYLSWINLSNFNVNDAFYVWQAGSGYYYKIKFANVVRDFYHVNNSSIFNNYNYLSEFAVKLFKSSDSSTNVFGLLNTYASFEGTPFAYGSVIGNLNALSSEIWILSGLPSMQNSYLTLTDSNITMKIGTDKHVGKTTDEFMNDLLNYFFSDTQNQTVISALQYSPTDDATNTFYVWRPGAGFYLPIYYDLQNSVFFIEKSQKIDLNLSDINFSYVKNKKALTIINTSGQTTPFSTSEIATLSAAKQNFDAMEELLIALLSDPKRTGLKDAVFGAVQKSFTPMTYQALVKVYGTQLNNNDIATSTNLYDNVLIGISKSGVSLTLSLLTVSYLKGTGSVMIGGNGYALPGYSYSYESNISINDVLLVISNDINFKSLSTFNKNITIGFIHNALTNLIIFDNFGSVQTEYSIGKNVCTYLGGQLSGNMTSEGAWGTDKYGNMIRDAIVGKAKLTSGLYELVKQDTKTMIDSSLSDYAKGSATLGSNFRKIKLLNTTDGSGHSSNNVYDVVTDCIKTWLTLADNTLSVLSSLSGSVIKNQYIIDLISNDSHFSVLTNTNKTNVLESLYDALSKLSISSEISTKSSIIAQSIMEKMSQKGSVMQLPMPVISSATSTNVYDLIASVPSPLSLQVSTVSALKGIEGFFDFTYNNWNWYESGTTHSVSSNYLDFISGKISSFREGTEQYSYKDLSGSYKASFDASASSASVLQLYKNWITKLLSEDTILLSRGISLNANNLFETNNFEYMLKNKGWESALLLIKTTFLPTKATEDKIKSLVGSISTINDVIDIISADSNYLALSLDQVTLFDSALTAKLIEYSIDYMVSHQIVSNTGGNDPLANAIGTALTATASTNKGIIKSISDTIKTNTGGNDLLANAIGTALTATASTDKGVIKSVRQDLSDTIKTNTGGNDLLANAIGTALTATTVTQNGLVNSVTSWLGVYTANTNVFVYQTANSSTNVVDALKVGLANLNAVSGQTLTLNLSNISTSIQGKLNSSATIGFVMNIVQNDTSFKSLPADNPSILSYYMIKELETLSTQQRLGMTVANNTGWTEDPVAFAISNSMTGASRTNKAVLKAINLSITDQNIASIITSTNSSGASVRSVVCSAFGQNSQDVKSVVTEAVQDAIKTVFTNATPTDSELALKNAIINGIASIILGSNTQDIQSAVIGLVDKSLNETNTAQEKNILKTSVTSIASKALSTSSIAMLDKVSNDLSSADTSSVLRPKLVTAIENSTAVKSAIQNVVANAIRTANDSSTDLKTVLEHKITDTYPSSTIVNSVVSDINLGKTATSSVLNALASSLGTTVNQGTKSADVLKTAIQGLV